MKNFLFDGKWVYHNRRCDEKRKIINLYYDIKSKTKEISGLYPDEKYKKTFKDINTDTTVIEILPEDEVPKFYFLIPPKVNIYNFNLEWKREIIILHWPLGELSFSYDKINEINKNEFAHLSNKESDSSGSPMLFKRFKRNFKNYRSI